MRRSYRAGADGVFYELLPTAAYKGPRVNGARDEREIFLDDADIATDLLRRAEWRIVKIRHQVVDAGTTWDLDVFLWENDGLVIAECEGSDYMDSIDPPPWCGEEVTTDPRFNNEQLAIRPYPTWKE